MHFRSTFSMLHYCTPTEARKCIVVICSSYCYGCNLIVVHNPWGKYLVQDLRPILILLNRPHPPRAHTHTKCKVYAIALHLKVQLGSDLARSVERSSRPGNDAASETEVRGRDRSDPEIDGERWRRINRLGGWAGDRRNRSRGARVTRARKNWLVIPCYGCNLIVLHSPWDKYVVQ